MEESSTLEYFFKTHGGLLLSVLGSFITLVVWLVRLEGRINQADKALGYVDEANKNSQKDIDELRIKHEVLDSKIVDQLTALKISVAEIKVFLFKKKED